MHTHCHNYQCVRYECDPSPPKDTLLIVCLIPGISRGCYRVWVYDVWCCCVRCADWYRYRVKGMPKVCAVVTYSSWFQLLEYQVPWLRRPCYSWSQLPGASYRCRRTWTCRNRHFHDYVQVPLMWPIPAVTVTLSLPRLYSRKLRDIRLEKSALKSPS